MGAPGLPESAPVLGHVAAPPACGFGITEPCDAEQMRGGLPSLLCAADLPAAPSLP